MRQNLRFEERNLKWKPLEQPLKELHRIFREGEAYIRHSLETKNWWAKAIYLFQNTDCVELYIHNLLTCFPAIIEAIEITAESSGWDHDEMQKRRSIYSNKYKREWKDRKIFQWKFQNQYLVTPDISDRIDTAWREDRWILLNKIKQKKISVSTRRERRLVDLLSETLNESEAMCPKLLPSKLLIRSEDYVVRRRLGSGSQYKEIQWLGESFAMRHIHGEIEPIFPQIPLLLSLSHPNIMHLLCGFADDDKKDCYLVMELMSKDLCSYIKEVYTSRKQVPFSLPVAVDIMLQIARGMEYLHSKKIYHGDLTPSNILVKSRFSSSKGYLHVKVAGFGLPSVKNITQRSPSSQNQNPTPPSFIWHAPEVLEEQDQTGSPGHSKFREKSDVYSFAMICFELLTGKVPFEDAHLQGEKMSRNIRAGERPLFPFNSPKYLTNLTKRCWQADPNQRPSFRSICRVLRYIKRFLMLNPDYNCQPDPPMPQVDYCEIEMRLCKEFTSWENTIILPISEIPFQMYVFRITEKEKSSGSIKDTSESGSDRTSISGDENMTTPDESIPPLPENRSTIPSPEAMTRRLTVLKRASELKVNKQSG